MKMNEFMTTLQEQLDDLQPNYPDNAQSVMEVLYNTYNEYSCFENEQIKLVRTSSDLSSF